MRWAAKGIEYELIGSGDSAQNDRRVACGRNSRHVAAMRPGVTYDTVVVKGLIDDDVRRTELIEL